MSETEINLDYVGEIMLDGKPVLFGKEKGKKGRYWLLKENKTHYWWRPIAAADIGLEET